MRASVIRRKHKTVDRKQIIGIINLVFLCKLVLSPDFLRKLIPSTAVYETTHRKSAKPSVFCSLFSHASAASLRSIIHRIIVNIKNHILGNIKHTVIASCIRVRAFCINLAGFGV